MIQQPPLLLNLGCGSTFSKDWRNYDINPSSPEVKYWNANKSIPSNDYNVDVVYNSHMLEHLNPSSGKKFLKECYRVLKKMEF